jgi:Transglutaminase-like superfamily
MSLSTQLLHLYARVGIRVWPPLEAKRRVDSLGSWLPRWEFGEAFAAAERLRGGSCLSRALVLAARMRDADVVIGRRAASPFQAHAWVESQGRSIGLNEPCTELARLR